VLQRIGAYRAALGCRLRRDGGCLFSQPSILARATAIASSRDPSKGTFVVATAIAPTNPRATNALVISMGSLLFLFCVSNNKRRSTLFPMEHRRRRPPRGGALSSASEGYAPGRPWCEVLVLASGTRLGLVTFKERAPAFASDEYWHPKAAH